MTGERRTLLHVIKMENIYVIRRNVAMGKTLVSIDGIHRSVTRRIKKWSSKNRKRKHRYFPTDKQGKAKVGATRAKKVKKTEKNQNIKNIGY